LIFFLYSEGPYVRFANSNDHDASGELVRILFIYLIYINFFQKIWHWTHTSQIENDHYNKRQIQAQKFMLITVPGIGETAAVVDP
jgi:hypothetical protein